MNNQEQQIIELNSTVKVRLAPSNIHGVGVFAIMDIKAGERCYCFPLYTERKWYSIPWGSLNKLFPEIKELVTSQWASIVNGSRFLSPNDVAWPICFMNHEPSPLANYEVKTDTALRDISKGDELTEDYCLMLNGNKVFPDLCK